MRSATPFFSSRATDLQHVADRSREPVELRHYEHIALADEFQGGFQLRPLPDARNLFLEDPLDTGRAQLAVLRLKAGDLFNGGCSGVTDDH